MDSGRFEFLRRRQVEVIAFPLQQAMHAKLLDKLSGQIVPPFDEARQASPLGIGGGAIQHAVE
jgi:hypothetical protein